MDDNLQVFGIDISQATFQARRYGSDQGQSISNTLPAIAVWLKRLPAGTILGMEATGIHHRLLASMAYAAGLRVYVFNPHALKHYAKGIRQRGKTDAVDAAMIARYTQHELPNLRPWEPPTPATDQLSQLLQRRHRLVEAKKSLMQSLSGVATLKHQRNTLKGDMERMIKNVELLIRKEIAQAPAMQALLDRLCTIVGVGFVVGAQLVACLTRHEFKSVSSFIAFAGLDPKPDQSGIRNGRRHISKDGHRLLRHMLYNAGMAAAHSKLFKPLYACLLARGLASTEAILILGRKIGRIAYAICRSGESFDRNHHLKTA
jgi:transposase